MPTDNTMLCKICAGHATHRLNQIALCAKSECQKKALVTLSEKAFYHGKL